MDGFLRRRATLLRRSWILAEAALAYLLFLGTVEILASHGGLPAADVTSSAVRNAAVAAAVIWPFCYYIRKLYHAQRLSKPRQHAASIVVASCYAVGLLSVYVIVSNSDEVSRSVVGTFFMAMTSATIIERLVVFASLRSIRRHGHNVRYALLLGRTPDIQRVVGAIDANAGWGLRIVGQVSLDNERCGEEGADTRIPVIGEYKNLAGLLDEHVVDELFLCAPPGQIDCLGELLAEAEVRGISVRLAVTADPSHTARVEFGLLDTIPIVTYTFWPRRTTQLLLKRVVDLVLATPALLATLPAMALIAIAVRLTSPGPAVFRQTRVGHNGRRFTLYKFRTMWAHAELLPEAARGPNIMNGPVFKSPNDPRLTSFGRWLRRWSLDELPQLFNVILADMSLVGPRPPLPTEFEQYAAWQKRRLSVRPGLTGEWQVSGRNLVDFDDWMKLDLEYIDNWSLSRDLSILARTLPAVISGRGAM